MARVSPRRHRSGCGAARVCRHVATGAAVIRGPRPTRRGTCEGLKAGGAGGAFDDFVGAMCVRRRVAYRANRTTNVRRMRAKRVAHRAMAHGATHRHQALPHIPWGSCSHRVELAFVRIFANFEIRNS
eukprot:1330695-Prymnesium_polylepis.1